MLEFLKKALRRPKLYERKPRFYFGGPGATFDQPYEESLAIESFLGTMYICANGNAKLVAGTDLFIMQKVNRPAITVEDQPVDDQSQQIAELNRVLDEKKEEKSRSHNIIRKSVSLGENYDIVEDNEDDLIQILSKPNDYTTGFEFIYRIMLQLQLVGKSFILISGRKLYILDPTKVRVILNESRTGIKSFRTDQAEYAERDVIFLKMPHPISPLEGYAPAKAAWEDIKLALNKIRSDSSVNRSVARPDLIVHMAGASEENLNNFMERWYSQLMGTGNTGKVLGIGGAGVNVHPIGSYTDYHYGVPKEIIASIAGAFNYPLLKLLGDDPVRANSLVSMNAWLKDMTGYTRLIEDAFNDKLVPRFSTPGRIVWFNVRGEDFSQSEDNRIISAVQSGILKPEEGREKLSI